MADDEEAGEADAGVDSFRPGWERLPEETAPAWAAFQMYRNLGRKRGVLAVIEALGLEYTDSRRRQYERWCSEHRWVARARARDAYLDHHHHRETSETSAWRFLCICLASLVRNFRAALTR
jgi:hypothetical protein